MNTRVGQVELRAPQARGYRDENGRPFYPKAPDRGIRSESAMILAKNVVLSLQRRTTITI